MSKKDKLYVHIKLEASKAPDMERSSINVRGTLESIIQYRFPEYDVEVATLEADWPGSDKNFPKIIID